MFVDALSRPPNAKALPRTYNPDIFCTAEDPISSLGKDVQNDEFYGPIARAMSRPNEGHSLMARQKQAITRLQLQPDGKLANKHGLILITKRLRPAILRMAHDQAGHYSHRYTLAKIVHSYMWPGVYSDVQNYCASCVTCNQANAARPRTKMPLERVTPPACKIGDRVHVDLLDMPKTTEGHVAICTLVDAATGFTIICPCVYVYVSFIPIIKQLYIDKE